MTVYNILIVEDEAEIAEAIEIYLKSQGYQTWVAHNGVEGIEVLKHQEIHLAIVDIMMPIMDGITFTMNIRSVYDFPVIMLSAKSEDIDKITGLNIGADDYVTKPFVPMELLARVHSHLRRYSRFLSMKQTPIEEKEHVLVIGGLELDKNTKEVTMDGTNIKLTPIEFKMLQMFMEHPGRVYSSDEIYEHVWKENAINTETVMVHIRNLREKIEVDSKKPQYIKVVWGVGYKIEKQER